MRVRRDSLFISSVLFTIALLCLVPWFLRTALDGHDKVTLQALDAGFRAEVETRGDLGVASLAIILIGLIVVWTGYVKRERWTWSVMFIVVWVWAFPLLVPLFKGRIGRTFSEWIYSAVYQPGSPRVWAESVLIFLLMVIALLLPIKSFLLVEEIQEPSHRLSPRLIGFSVVSVLVVLIALFAWADFRVHEIPLTGLNSTQRLPPPPPPPFAASLVAQSASDQADSSGAQEEQARKIATQTKTITGCLQKGYEPDEFSITGEDGKVWGLRSSSVRFDGHLGHKVTVSGLITHELKVGETKAAPGKEESGDLRVTSLTMVSGTCGK